MVIAICICHHSFCFKFLFAVDEVYNQSQVFLDDAYTTHTYSFFFPTLLHALYHNTANIRFTNNLLLAQLCLCRHLLFLLTLSDCLVFNYLQYSKKFIEDVYYSANCFYLYPICP